MVEKKIFQVEASEAGERADAFLARRLAGEFSRSEISRLARKGRLSVAGEAVKPGYLLRAGQEVVLTFERKKPRPAPDGKVRFSTIYEDEFLLVVDKPAGLQTHPDRRENCPATLADGILARYPALAGVGEDPARPGIVHRLDADTSGLLVLAKTDAAFAALKRAFAERKIRKTYLALTRGHLPAERGKIDFPIARSPVKGKRKVLVTERERELFPDFRRAETHYRILRRYPDGDLAAVFPRTGRTHQIRLHLAAVGAPIVGDKLYGGKRKFFLSPRRHFLHAWKLDFSLFGRRYVFASPPPEDLREILRKTASRSRRDNSAQTDRRSGDNPFRAL